MQAHIDELSNDLIERYKLYIATFLVDLICEEDMIELRFGYSLRGEHRLQSRSFKVCASGALDHNDLLAIVDALFSEIEMQIDESISVSLVELN